MTSNEIENHIGIFPNAMSKKICKDYIKYFEEIKDTLKHSRYTKTAHEVSDTSTDIYSNIFNHGISSKYINAAASEIIWSKYIDYSKKYSVLNDLKTHAIIDVKIARPMEPKTEIPNSTRCLLIMPATIHPNAMPIITIAQTMLVSSAFKCRFSLQ